MWGLEFDLRYQKTNKQTNKTPGEKWHLRLILISVWSLYYVLGTLLIISDLFLKVALTYLLLKSS